MRRLVVGRRPDVIFLVLDTQRADKLSCYGNEANTSPHLDAFAADATRFRHAYAPAQWTIPSHGSMFTGVYPSVHGLQQANSVLPDALPTLGERFAAGGYYTAAFCNNPLVGVVNNGFRRGFVSWLNYAGLLTSRPNQAGKDSTWVNRYRQWFKRILGNALNKVQDAFARSDALLSFAFTPFMVPLWQTALSFKGNIGKSLRDTATLHIDRKGVAADQPIFSFVNLMGTHMPYHPPRRFVEKFAPQVLHDKEAQHYLQRFNSDPFGWLAPLAEAMGDSHRAILEGMYNAEVANQDEYLGQFFSQLRQSGVLDNTLVVIVADHGEHLGEKHMIGHTISLYQELTHVPLIIRDPSNAFPRETTLDQPVSTRRLFQTMLTAADIATEAERAYSLAPTATPDPDHGLVFAESVPSSNVLSLVQKHVPQLIKQHRYDQPRRAVWHGTHKLIRTGDDQSELFDINADPRENHTLAASQPDLVATMNGYISEWQSHPSSAPLPAGALSEGDDALLQKRLRALGYL
jgi:arylsulfatase A-like enzyme